LSPLEAEAREAKRGLWSQPHRISPWQWRKGEGVPQAVGFVGNKRSRVYHKSTCRAAATMSERNRVTFASEVEAQEAGYRPAGDCSRR
jgi:hypothetical protein